MKYPGKKIRTVYGTSEKKDSYNAMKIIAMESNNVHLIQANHFRSKDITELLTIK